jgi:hypothetical protein
MTAIRVMRLPPASTVELDSLIRSPFGAGEQRQRDFEGRGLWPLKFGDSVARVSQLPAPSLPPFTGPEQSTAFR